MIRVVQQAVKAFTSGKFAVALVLVIVAVCAVVTLIPQGLEVIGYLEKHPQATARMQLLDRCGLTHIYSAPWFMALLGLFTVSMVAVSGRRFRAFQHTTGTAQRRALGSILVHVSVLLILAGALIRGVWGEKGSVEFREGETVTHFAAANGTRGLPFQIRLNDFTVERYTATGQPVKSFKSTLQFADADGTQHAKTIEVNCPFSHRGYTFYQAGYDPADPTFSALAVVKDPGVPVVYAGFALMIVGLVTVFWPTRRLPAQAPREYWHSPIAMRTA